MNKNIKFLIFCVIKIQNENNIKNKNIGQNENDKILGIVLHIVLKNKIKDKLGDKQNSHRNDIIKNKRKYDKYLFFKFSELNECIIINKMYIEINDTTGK